MKMRACALAWPSEIKALPTSQDVEAHEHPEVLGARIHDRLASFMEKYSGRLDVWTVSITPEVDLSFGYAFSRTYSYAFLEDPTSAIHCGNIDTLKKKHILAWVSKNAHRVVAYNMAHDLGLDKTAFRVVKRVDLSCGEYDFAQPRNFKHQ